MVKGKKNTMKTIVLGITLMLIAPGLLSCKQSNAREEKITMPVKVLIGKVKQVSDYMIIRASSFLEAEKTSPISFQIPGKIIKINCDLGDHVNKNQVVAQIEMDDYQSHLEIAQAKLMQTKDTFDRLGPLFKEDVIPENTLILATTRLAQAIAGKNIAEKQVRDTKLRTPFAGVVGSKTIETGQMISPGIPVFTIIKNDMIYACSSIPESEIGQIKTGQTAMVKVPALENQIFSGRIERMGAVADPKTRTYKVKILLNNSDFILRPGMIANVAIQTDKKIQMLTIPSRTIVRDFDNLTYVFLADEHHERAFRKRVFPGSVYKRDTRIKKGLLPGDTLVIAGQHKLSDGCAITVIEN